MRGNIKHDESNATGEYNRVLFTAGAGYAWKFYKNFYLAPHVAFTLGIGGDKEVQIEEFEQSLPLFQPEGGLRVGFYF